MMKASCIKFVSPTPTTGWTEKRGIKRKMALTSFKLIRKGHVGGVLKNLGYLGTEISKLKKK